MSIIRDLVTRWRFDIDDSPLRQMESSVSDLKSTLFSLGLVFAGLTASIGFFVKKAGDMEQTTVAFETMLGSASKAQDLIASLVQFAKVTPFQLTGLLDTTKHLLAFGFGASDVIPILTTLGNISAGVGMDKLPHLVLALGQTRAATRLTGRELLQFTQTGVPLLGELAKHFGITEAAVTQMIHSGSVKFSDVQAALEHLATGSGRFANLMDKQSKTVLGQWSNLIDVLEILSIDIGKKLLPVIGPLIQNFSDFVTQNKELIKTKIVEFLLGTLDAFQKFYKITLQVVLGMSRIFDLLNANRDTVSTMITLVTALFGFKILNSVGNIAKAVGVLGLNLKLGTSLFKGFTFAAEVLVNLLSGNFLIAITTFTTGLRSAFLVIGSYPALIAGAFVALFLILEDIYTYFQGGDSYFGDLMKWLKSGAMSSIGDQIAKYLTDPLIKALDYVIEKFIQIKNFFTGESQSDTAATNAVGDFTEQNFGFRVTGPRKAEQPKENTSKVPLPPSEKGGLDTNYQENTIIRGFAPQTFQENPIVKGIGASPKANPFQNVLENYNATEFRKDKQEVKDFPFLSEGKDFGPGVKPQQSYPDAQKPLWQLPNSEPKQTPMPAPGPQTSVQINQPITINVGAGANADEIARRTSEAVKKSTDESLRSTNLTTKPQVAY